MVPPTTAMLDEPIRHQIKERLLDEIAVVEERIMELEKQTAPIPPDKGLGRLTRMDALQDKSVKEEALRQARKSQGRLEVALTRVLAPDFGDCAGCRGPIGVERLLALPGSTLCVACASKR